MKRNIFIISALTLLLTASCNDYLDIKPISQETTDNAYVHASQLEAALTGSYESFQSAEYYVWDNVLLQDVRSDNCYAGGDNPEIFQMDFLNISPTNSRIMKNWSNIYNAIAKANVTLENAPLISDPVLTEERRSQIIGEALFLRAYHYYNLVTMWGGVPLVLEPVKSADPSVIRVSRASEQQVYDQILVDLTRAIQLLPEVYSDPSYNKSRATKGAANALAAKACMQMPNRDYPRALTFISNVESSKANYKLISYDQLFDGQHYNNAESIIEIQYLGGTEGTYGPQLLLPPSISGDIWRKFATPSHDLINAYDAEGDVVRKNASVIFEKANLWSDEYWGNAKGSSIPFAYKWKNAGGWKSADHIYLIRLADVILLKAEALNETGDINGAAAEVNKIRVRAQLPVLSSAQMSSKEVLKNTILKERRLELALEAQRWTDLVRFGVAVSTMKNLVEIDLRTGNPVVYPMTDAKILLPIPQGELDNNPNLTQNPL